MQSGDQIHQVRQATDIVELIGQQIRIQPKGREFVALCPFHDDSNPSMTVSPTKQIYKCFACGAGGGAFDWMINYHKMTFPEALRFLAERAGITLERRGRESGDQPNDRQRMSEATEHALGWFRATLGRPQGATARAYVEQRGISPEMVEQFQLGCAPDAWDDLAQDVAANRWDPRSFRSAGLIHGRQSGSGDIDRFRHRLMFPIFDGLGRPIAFGGRILPRQTPSDREEAKYLNSPESALFNKSATLYGLHLARNEIGKRRCAVIVEGYTDVIACHQHGLSHVVATLGTALTTQHVGVLRRFSEKVVLVFDADEAGQKAADRAVEVFLGGELDVAVSILPDGLDPASLLEQADGAARFEALLSEATDALDYQFQRVADEYRGASTMAGQHRIAEQYVDRLADLGLITQGALRRAMIIQRLAELLHLKRDVVVSMIDKARRRASARPARRGQPDRSPETLQNPGQNETAGAAPAPSGLPVEDRADELLIGPNDEKNSDIAIASEDSRHRINSLLMAQRQLIGCLLTRPDLFHEPLADGRTLDEAVTASEMVSDAARRLYDIVYQRLCHDGTPFSLSELLTDLARDDQAQLRELATQAEDEVERMTNGDEVRIRELIDAAVRSIERWCREVAHQRVVAVDDGDEQRLRLIQEHRRANPSASRIARLGSAAR